MLFVEIFVFEGIVVLIGFVGDVYDNVLVELMIGLLKNEVI